jgi:hypothetical protein
MKLLVFGVAVAVLICGATCLFGQAVGIISVFSDETGFFWADAQCTIRLVN